MATTSSLQRAAFPIAVILAVVSAHRFSQGALLGGLSIAVALSVRGLPARVFVGLGAGWLIATLHPTPIDLTTVALDRPVIIRGHLAASARQDSWGQWRQSMQVESVRQGSRVAAGRLQLDLVSRSRLASGRLRVKGYLRSWGCDWSMQVSSPVLVSRPQRHGHPAPAPAESLRERMRARAQARLRLLVPARDRQSLLESLVFGRPRALDPELRTAFRRMGLGHLFAVSGLHVGILALTVWVMAAAGPALMRRTLMLLAVLAYAAVLDPRGSILRASLVLVAWQATEMLGRRLETLPALATCVAVIICLQPSWATDLGLQLSVLAVIGIALLGVPLASAFGERWKWPCGLLAIGIGAQVTTLPLASTKFHWLPLLAPVYGVIAIPWTAAILVLTLLLVALPSVSGVAAIPAFLLNQLLAMGVWLAGVPPHRLDGQPAASPDGWVYSGGLAACALAVIAARRFGRHRGSALAIGLASCGVASLAWVLVPAAQEREQMVLLDVGQGDATLISQGGRHLLIDGGSSSSVLLERLAERRVRTLDVVVITHPDRDHCASAADIGRWIRVREVWTSSGWDRECYWRLLVQPGSRLRTLWAGQQRRWRGVGLQVLAPSARGTRVDNDDSLVMQVRAGDLRVLMTGDVEVRGERKLLRRWSCTELESEVLKVAHHGGGSSTRQGLIACVSPLRALVSTGAGNRFGHPAADVLSRLQRAGVEVLRTDRDGSIAVELE